MEVVDWENVLARLDDCPSGVLDRIVGVERVQLFLSDDDLQNCEDVFDVRDVPLCVALDSIRDVGDQVREEGDFEELVEGDELEDGLVSGLEGRGQGSVREGAVGLKFLIAALGLSNWGIRVP